MTWELLYRVSEEIKFPIIILKYILTTQITEYIDVSNVHHLFSRYKKLLQFR